MRLGIWVLGGRTGGMLALVQRKRGLGMMSVRFVWGGGEISIFSIFVGHLEPKGTSPISVQSTSGRRERDAA